MEKQYTKLNEGILTSFVDNFFKSLQRGVSSSFMAKIKKADVHPDVVSSMERVAKETEELNTKLRKYHLL
jgi:hypothetical protein